MNKIKVGDTVGHELYPWYEGEVTGEGIYYWRVRTSVGSDVMWHKLYTVLKQHEEAICS